MQIKSNNPNFNSGPNIGGWSDNQDYIVLEALNFLVIKEKLIYLGYYLYYGGKESIKALKSKNDYIVLKLLAENN